jgi:hypothetical protein
MGIRCIPNKVINSFLSPLSLGVNLESYNYFGFTTLKNTIVE